MSKLAKLAAMLGGLAVLGGCAGQTAVIVSCDAWKRIMISKHDSLTRGTAEQIEGNNRGREAAGCMRRKAG